MGMNPQQRAEHIRKRCKNKAHGIEWINIQKDKPIHESLNPNKLSDEEVVKYWEETLRIFTSM